MRIRESFVLYKRRLSSGKVVFYYRTYDAQGQRLCGHSTGQTTKTGAREVCMKLLREGKLIPDKQDKVIIPTFRKFAEGWWDFDTCAYLQSRKGRRVISKSYAATGKAAMNNWLIPEFGDKRLDTITDFEIDQWLTGFTNQTHLANDGKTVKHFKSGTANVALAFLRVMLDFAVKQKLLKYNPCAQVEKLKIQDRKVIKILTPLEVKALFPENWETVWDSHLHYMLNKLAACTGMRIGELLGLRGEFVFDNYIDVCGQYNRFGYGDTKTHKARNIPLPSGLVKDLNLLKQENGDGYLFSTNGGKKPILREFVSTAFYKALERIGIDEKQRQERNITMHGWRHFFNTTLLMANVGESKVRSVTGHSSEAMTKRYTHFDTTQFTEVLAVQENLLSYDKGSTSELTGQEVSTQ
jgi:integrase